MEIHVYNLRYDATDADLHRHFEQHGTVTTATINLNQSGRHQGKSDGSGIVVMENREEGEKAIEALDGQEMMGRELRVNEPHPQGTPQTGDEQDCFHNPYTFVPTPPREEAISQGGFAGDFNPLDCGLDHASLKDGLWTGHIPIKLTTVTPLVLLKVEGKNHPSNKPYDVFDRIPESSLRGMLRSAYEVITNSRYGCFRNSEPLAYRMVPKQALDLIPAIIERDPKTDELVARLYTGTSHPTVEGPKKLPKRDPKKNDAKSAKKGAMYSAMLTLYHDDRKKHLNTKCVKTYSPKEAYKPRTGDEVKAEIVLCSHRRGYLYWKAIQVCPSSTSLEPMGVPEKWEYLCYTDPSSNEHIVKVVSGQVLITNENIKGKHDERIFFSDSPTNVPEIIGEPKKVNGLKEVWKKRIESYRSAHPDKDDIFKRKGAENKPWKKIISDDPGKTAWAWSPHQYQDSTHKEIWLQDPCRRRSEHDATDLRTGDMVYARCKFENGKIVDVKDFFPVIISRDFYNASPEALLDASLRPARSRYQLSPADRLFGWVPQGSESEEEVEKTIGEVAASDAPKRKEGAKGYKSRVRIVYDGVVCKSEECPDIIKRFDGGLPLAILGEPKPAQGRFYVGDVTEDRRVIPQEKGVDKVKAGYSRGKGLRGRKQYWHHQGLEANTDQEHEYWNPLDDLSINGRYKEYLRPKGKLDSQNRSIKGWIKPNTEFKATLYVQNLQAEEVGALLWLLTLPDKHYFRLGYGKPLGFGSVRMEIDCTDQDLPIGTGEDWKNYYAGFDKKSSPTTADRDAQCNWIEKLKRSFMDSMKAAYPSPKHYVDSNQNFDNLLFISGFRRVLRGPKKDLPIHYPRTTGKPKSDGKNFEWFVDNDHKYGKKLVLPEVTSDKGLPYKPKT